MLKNGRDWIFTIPFYVAFGLTLAVYDIAMRIARRFGTRPMSVVVSSLQRSLVRAIRICGTRIEVERDPAVKGHTPYLILTNHQDMMDIPLFGAELFSNFVKYVAKIELGGYIPSISYNLKYGGNALIDRSDRRQAISAITALGERVASDGVAALIFPEGTRSKDGVPGPYRIAGAKALLRAAPDVPVVAGAIDGTWHLGRNRFAPVPFGTTVRIAIGAPMARSADDEVALIQAAESWMLSKLAEWRQTEPPTIQPD
ncbi:MAG: 1-acyl-sn-glycerol-3-phosphate acyltransferase [Acidimicrobiia bacterium]|nr:1-acyl-sn-glycerol-3-phosphate acyltransferase [Acidimicrobiia bacterium]